MTRFERWSLGTILWASTCSACHPASLVPMTWRPDTRMIWGVHLDSVAVRQTMQVLQKALPNEGAVCYQGALHDTLMVAVPDGTSVRVKLLWLTSAVEADHDSVDKFHVYGVDCPGTHVAIGHSHPYSHDCDHSLPDADVLAGDTQSLVSIVWCGGGDAQVMYQDTRRTVSPWREK